jgi:hypothetical protein
MQNKVLFCDERTLRVKSARERGNAEANKKGPLISGPFKRG